MPIRESLFNECNLLLHETFGYVIPPGKIGELESKLHSAMANYPFADVNLFITYILQNRNEPDVLRLLAIHFTVSETYFFREKPLFNFLPGFLSALIREKRKTSKKIRIWSAGCSSGEEPYSLAILLHQLIPDITEWDIKIFATDINTLLIEKAGQGIYQKWSFRGVSETTKERYFLPISDLSYVIIDEIKRLVFFQEMNLIRCEYPSIISNIYNMDIIFCRNVLMYFGEDVRTNVLDAFYKTLSTDGCLFLALTELSYVGDSGYTITKESDVTYYQKNISGKPRTLSHETPPNNEPLHKSGITNVIENDSANSPESSSVQTSESISILDWYQKLTERFLNKEYKSVIDSLESLLEREADAFACNEESLEAMFILMIKSQIYMGNIQRAEYWAKIALKKTVLNHELYFLYAAALYRVAAYEEAISLLKKTLYLEPDFIAAHYLLLHTYQRTNREAEFYKALAILKKLLEPLEVNVTIDMFEKITTGTLKKIIHSLNYSSKIPE